MNFIKLFPNNMKHLFYTLCVLLSAIGVQGQTDVMLKINHKLNGNDFSFTQEAINNINIEFNVKRLQYYLSQISITHDGGKETQAADVYALVNANEETIINLGNYDITTVEAINFSVGVNTPENNEDPTQWPNDHPLYPKSPSMHWGWTAGYRFVAMEGYGSSSFNRKYEIHSLGNDNYFDVSIPTSATEDNSDLIIEINADYSRALENIDVSGGLISHGSTGKPVVLLKNFRDHVFTSMSGEGNTLSIADHFTSEFVVYPNPSNGTITVSEFAAHQVASIEIYNIHGEIVQRQAQIFSNTLSFELPSPGVYFIELVYEDRSRITRKIINN